MTVKYTPDHEWIQIAGADGIAMVGITHHAQDALGDVVFVDLPAVGTQLKQKDVAGVVESVKAAADLYARSAAKSSRSTRSCAPTRRWPTATRSARAGSSRCASPTPPSWTHCSTRPPTTTW